ncbi:MAG: MFS transporter [Bifidobacteriaceae bacterium]|jgi:CP family cyanate transporter-like MFS transporter|nr:MFS transporter [Bifidobacteriaceae bacterium]
MPKNPGRSIWRGRLTVLAGLIILALNLRAAVTTVSPMLDRIRAEVAFSPLTESLIATAPPLMFAIFGSLAPLAGRRWGLERVIAGAMGIAALATAARAVTGDELVFLITTVLVMAGLGMANVTIPPLVKRYFPDRVGLMTTASTLFLVAGQAIPPAFAVPLADRLGWRWAIGVWAIGAALAGLPWIVQPYRRGRRQRQGETGGPGRSRARAHGRARASAGAGSGGSGHVDLHNAGPGPARVFRAPSFWGIAGLLTCNSVAAYALMGWLPQIMIDAGASHQKASACLAVFTAGSLVPALVAPVLTVRLKRLWPVFVVMFVCWVGGLAGLALSPLHGTWWWIVLTRIGDGNYACALTLMNLRTRRTETLLAVSGFAQAIAYICAALATFAFGQLYAGTQGWGWPLALLACTMPLGLVGGIVAARRTYVEDQELQRSA